MGEEVETVRLVGDALVEAIKRKLVEESFEVSDAKTAGSIAEELADVQEVIDALAAVLKIRRRRFPVYSHAKGEKGVGLQNARRLIALPLALRAGDIAHSKSEEPQCETQAHMPNYYYGIRV